MSLEDSYFSDDLDFAALWTHLPLLVDVVKQSDPVIIKVTSQDPFMNGFIVYSVLNNP